jgi:undecaprenyl pyrophosphate phosphatase UppP
VNGGWTVFAVMPRAATVLLNWLTKAVIDELPSALGSAVAAITAFATVKWLLRYVQTHTFNVFGYYRILLGALILLLVR